MVNFKKLSAFIPHLTVAFVLLLCLLVWPLRIIGHTTYENASLDDGIFPNLKMEDNSVVISEFTPAHSQLDSISFRFLISGKAPDGTVTLDIYDDTQEVIYSVTLDSGDIMNYRWIHFPVDMELDTERTYSFMLRAYDYDLEESSLSLYSGGVATGPDESGQLYYNGSPMDELIPAIIFSYTDRIDAKHALPYYTTFLLFGMLLLTALRKFEKPDKDVDL